MIVDDQWIYQNLKSGYDLIDEGKNFIGKHFDRESGLGPDPNELQDKNIINSLMKSEIYLTFTK